MLASGALARPWRRQHHEGASSSPGPRGGGRSSRGARQQVAPRLSRRCWRVRASPDLRDTRKKLTRLFYFDGAASAPTADGAAARGGAAQGPLVEALPLWRTETVVLPASQEVLHVFAPHYVHMFEGLFASRPRPWLFGHLHLPGGSKNLADPAHRLASGSRAPLVGVLMQVTRAVRLSDGKFLVLCTAVCRFRVVRCLQELPFSVADVELLEDAEQTEKFSEQALAAVMQAASDDAGIGALMAAGGAAARAAASAWSWSWLRGYELRVAAQQEWPGPGPREGESDLETHQFVQELGAGVSEVLPLPDGVVIGRSDLAATAAAADEAVRLALQQAAAQLCQASGSGGGGGGGGGGGPADVGAAAAGRRLGSCWVGGEEPGPITTLNTTSERGIRLLGVEFEPLTGGAASSCSTEEVLVLEAAVWAQLDLLVGLASRIRGRRHMLPFGLLQLRPPPLRPEELAMHLAATAPPPPASQQQQQQQQQPPRASKGLLAAGGREGAAPERGRPEGALPPVAEVASDAEGSVDGSPAASFDGADAPSAASPSPAVPGGAQQQQQAAAAGASPSPGSYAYAASDGMEMHANPLFPPLRRAARLSWAAAAVIGALERDTGRDVRQCLLECASVAQRLRFVSAVLGKHAKVLAALAAVNDVKGPGG